MQLNSFKVTLYSVASLTSPDNIGEANITRKRKPEGNHTLHPARGFKEFLEDSRELYLDAFKNNVAGAELKYYASSTAQFIVLGRARMEAAMELVKQDYEELFSPYYIQRGRNYIAPYLTCISG